MNERRRVERLLDDWIRAEAPARAESVVLAGALGRVADVDQRRPLADRLVGNGSRQSRWLRIALVAVLLAIALVGTALLAGSFRSDPIVPPGLTEPNGWIAYLYRTGPVRDLGGNPDGDIAVVRPGVAPTRVIGDDVELLDQRCPHFLPDGSTLAYVEGDQLVLATLDDAGRPVARIAEIGFPGGSCVHWSPDGRRLAVQGRHPEQDTGFVAIKRVEGGVVRDEVTLATGEDIHAVAWAPDGLRLAIADQPGGPPIEGQVSVEFAGSLSILGLDGSRQELIGSHLSDWGGDAVLAVDWSPDGRRLAFGVVVGSSVWIVNADGSGLRRLMNGADRHGEYGMGPVWAPDGRRIAISKDDEILVVDADDPTSVVRIPARAGSGMRWSPDGAYLLYVAYDGDFGPGGDYAIAIAAADGRTAPQYLTPWIDGLYWTDKEGLSWQAVPVGR